MLQTRTVLALTLTLTLVFLWLPSGAQGEVHGNVGNHWEGGFQGEFNINVPTALDGWTIRVIFDQPVSSLNIWEEDMTKISDNVFELTNKYWNSQLNPGDTLKIHFNADTPGEDIAPEMCAFIVGVEPDDACDPKTTTPTPPTVIASKASSTAGVSVPTPVPTVESTLGTSVPTPPANQESSVGVSIPTPLPTADSTPVPTPLVIEGSTVEMPTPVPTIKSTSGTSVPTPVVIEGSTVEIPTLMPSVASTHGTEVPTPVVNQDSTVGVSIPTPVPSVASTVGTSVPTPLVSEKSTAEIPTPPVNQGSTVEIPTPMPTVESTMQTRVPTPPVNQGSTVEIPTPIPTVESTMQTMQTRVPTPPVNHAESSVGTSVPTPPVNLGSTREIPTPIPTVESTVGTLAPTPPVSRESTIGVSAPIPLPTIKSTPVPTPLVSKGSTVEIPTPIPPVKSTVETSVPTPLVSEKSTIAVSVPTPVPTEKSTTGASVPTLKPPTASTQEIPTLSPRPSVGSSPGVSIPTAMPTDASTTGKGPHIKDFAEALRLSQLFYYAQRSGKLPADNPIPWRNDSALDDCVVGGWYDAGDHVKFGFPMAGALTILLWGAEHFRQGYEAANQLDTMYDTVKWGLDYLLDAWNPFTEELVIQIGDGDVDHQYWGRPEEMTMPRPCVKIGPNRPGSDVAGETAAALAAGAIVFRDKGDMQYAARLLEAAESIYDFAKENRERFSDTPPITNQWYYGSNDDKDEMCEAGVWLYKATGDEEYLVAAKHEHEGIVPEEYDWNNKIAACQLLLYEATHSDSYKTDVENFLNSWLPGGNKLYTPCGFAWGNATYWGSARHVSNVAFAALVAAEDGINQKQNQKWAAEQLNYLLGDNPHDGGCFSFEIGYGNKYPLRPHHRAASCADPPAPCSEATNLHTDSPSPQTLYGGLVGGPIYNDGYNDSREDYVHNEVALDYNAGFQSALAGLNQLVAQGQFPHTDNPCPCTSQNPVAATNTAGPGNPNPNPNLHSNPNQPDVPTPAGDPNPVPVIG